MTTKVEDPGGTVTIRIPSEEAKRLGVSDNCAINIREDSETIRRETGKLATDKFKELLAILTKENFHQLLEMDSSALLTGFEVYNIKYKGIVE